MIKNKAANAIKYLNLANETNYIGEPVSQLQHALQCAYFAEQAGHSEEVILACLFHDIGHFACNLAQFKMAELGIIYHEWISAKLVYDLGFSKIIALLIGYHVDAKRYLAKKENYYEKLSPASKQTLTFQGGPMSDEEMKIFEKHLYFKEILQVRINDEKAKVKGLQVPEVEHYQSRIENNLQATSDIHNNFVLTEFIDKSWITKFKNYLEKV